MKVRTILLAAAMLPVLAACHAKTGTAQDTTSSPNAPAAANEDAQVAAARSPGQGVSPASFPDGTTVSDKPPPPPKVAGDGNGMVSLNQTDTSTHQLKGGGDSFSFDAKAGERIEFAAFSDAFRVALTTVSPGGVRHQMLSTTPDNGSARIFVFSPTDKSGSWRVTVASAGPLKTGEYTLQVSRNYVDIPLRPAS